MADFVFFETFPLDSTPHEHRGMAWPEGDFEPGGAWTQAWDICSLAGRRGASIGSVTLRRTAARDGLFDLAMLYRKRIYYAGQPERFFWHQTRAEMRCREDVLATVEQWKFETQSEDWEGRVKAGTRIAASGRWRSRATRRTRW